MSSGVGYVGPLPEMDKSTPPQPIPTAAQNVAPAAPAPAPAYGAPPPSYGEAVGAMPPPDPGAPLPYEQRRTVITTESTVPVQQGGFRDITCNKEHLKTIPGILQIVECMLSLLTFICASVHAWGGGQGWVRFVAMSAFLSTLVYLILHLIGFYTRVVFWRPIRMIYYCVFSVLFWIAFIVSAAYADRAAAIGASAFFAFCAAVVYSADTFLQLRDWKRHRDECAENTAYMTTTVYTTTTTTAAPPPGGAMQLPPGGQQQPQPLYK